MAIEYIDLRNNGKEKLNKIAEIMEWQTFYSEYKKFGKIKIDGIEYTTTWRDSTFLSGKENQIIFLEPPNNVGVSHFNYFIFNKNMGIIGFIIDGTHYIRTDIKNEFKLE